MMRETCSAHGENEEEAVDLISWRRRLDDIRESRIATRQLVMQILAWERCLMLQTQPDRLIADMVAKFNWDPKAVPFDQFDARSVGNARNARESQVYRDKFMGSISDRLSADAVKAQALDLFQELFLADGAQSDEEDVVLQHLRQLLE